MQIAIGALRAGIEPLEYELSEPGETLEPKEQKELGDGTYETQRICRTFKIDERKKRTQFERKEF